MNVAFIPVRGGSKSIPLKNIKEINGKPLVYWVVKAACECKCIDEVFVATDSNIIKETVETIKKCGLPHFEKLSVIGRSNENASDTASTESVMLEFAEEYQFDNIVLIQATSPLLTAEDLDRGFEVYSTNGVDSVLSAVKQKRFIWKEDSKGYADANNYDYKHRPRRQEFQGYFVENGAFYITSKNRLLETKNRISGNIRISEMPEESYLEIDEPSDWLIIEQILRNRVLKDKSTAKPQIPKLFLMDCDGVLTDGGMYYSETGDELKKFNTKDGMGIRFLHEHGVKVGIITGEDRLLNERRARKLHLEFLVQGVSDKLAVIKEICANEKVDLSEVLYIGDDMNDLEVLENVGLGCTVADGRPELKRVADYITSVKGGEGAVREVVDWVLGEN